MDDDYIFYDNERELQADFHALDRAEIFNETYRDIKDKTQRFKTFVAFVATEMKDTNTIDLKMADINFLTNTALKIPTPGYKNPTAYILGYVLLKKGYTKTVFEKDIVPILGQLTYSINPHDVIRYARLLEPLMYIS